jgi:hypothetical protein
MRTALEQSKDSAKGPDDAARFKSLLDALADAYREESVKLVDQVRATHARNGSDVVEYIKLLGENKNLDPRQQLHRDMLQQFFIVARKQAPAAVIPPRASSRAAHPRVPPPTPSPGVECGCPAARRLGGPRHPH